jgi:hypothetical protein
VLAFLARFAAKVRDDQVAYQFDPQLIRHRLSTLMQLRRKNVRF